MLIPGQIAGQVMPRLPVPLDDAREWPSLNRAALVVSAGLGGWLAATISVGLARLVAPAANLELIASIIIVGAGALVVFSVALQTATYGADVFFGGHDGLGTATAGGAWGHRPVLRIIRFLVLASVAFAIARADVPSSAAGADLRA